MKKRLLSMLMAVLMIASLVPATALAAPDHTGHDVLTFNITADAAAKQPGIKFKFCNTCAAEGKDGWIEKAVVSPFVDAKDVCSTHKHVTTKVLQEGTCEQVKLSLTYCTDCGSAVKATDPVVVDNKMVGKHSYSKFEVSYQPTCKDDGWGYTVCDKCGEPEVVVGAKQTQTGSTNPVSALDYLYYGKAANEVKSATADAIYAKFAAKTHDKNDAFVTPEKNVYVDQWVKNQGDDTGYIKTVLFARAAVEPTHVATVSGTAVVNADGKVSVMPIKTGDAAKTAYLNPANTGAGNEADVYCPSCMTVVTKGKDLDGLNVAHDMTLTAPGYYPYMDAAGVKHDGVTDTWHCNDCNKDFGGAKIAYADFYKTSYTQAEWAMHCKILVDYGMADAYSVTYGYAAGEKVIIGVVAATCQAAGSTGATYIAVKDSMKGLIWKEIVPAETTPMAKHTWKPVESKAATCHSDGWTVSNYYVCVNDLGGGKLCNMPKAGGVVTFAGRVAPMPTAKVLIAPTCTTKGLTVIVDATCGDLMCRHDGVDEKYNSVDKCTVKNGIVPHTAAAELKGAKEATCTEVGYTGDKVCKWCGIVIEKGKEIPMKEHTVVDVAAVAATCTADGMTAGTKCSVCGTVLSGCEVVKALGHDYKDGKCTRCGEKDPNYVAPEFKDAASIRDYAKDAVAWAAKEGIVKGDDNGNFLPTADITRQDFVTMLWRLKGSVASEKALTFGDKADIKDYAQTAVAWAVENGYIKGRDNGNFDPAAKITRAEIVAILNRIAENAKAEKAADFTDIATHWAKDAIAWAAEAGIVNGVGNNMFAPNDNASRQDTVVMLYKFVNLK